MSNQTNEKVWTKTSRTSIEDTDFGAKIADREITVAPAENKSGARKPAFIAASLIAVVVLATIAFWFWRNGSSEEGRAVPAPRTVSFGDAPTTDVAANRKFLITLSPEQAKSSEIKMETVGEQLSSQSGTAAATGTVQANAYRETPILSLAGGVVRRINAELGQTVNRGQTIAVVFSEEFSAAKLRYISLLTEVDTARRNYDRESKLVRISPTSNAELDEATAKRKSAEAEFDEHHKHHERTQKLVAIGAASREELEQANTKLRTAEAGVVEARRRYERAVQISRINPVNRSSFEEAANQLRKNESELSTTRERLLLLGMSPQAVAALESNRQTGSELALAAPISGTITSRSVNTGEVIEANKEIMRVTDLSSVWVIAQVYEKDLAQLRTGSGASVTSSAYPDRLFRGQVSYIDPNINTDTRTAQVRVELANPGQALKIGMYVGVAFGSLGDAENTMPVVPASAVQNVNNQRVIFAATDQPNVYEMRPVQVGQETNQLYPVIEGVTVGDRIVTEGSFLLRAEFLKLNPNGQ